MEKKRQKGRPNLAQLSQSIHKLCKRLAFDEWLEAATSIFDMPMDAALAQYTDAEIYSLTLCSTVRNSKLFSQKQGVI